MNESKVTMSLLSRFMRYPLQRIGIAALTISILTTTYLNLHTFTRNESILNAQRRHLKRSISEVS